MGTERSRSALENIPSWSDLPGFLIKELFIPKSMTEEEIIAAQVHRYHEIRHWFDKPFRKMANLEVEGLENLVNCKGPALLYAPHKFDIDWLAIGIASEQFLRVAYIDQFLEGKYWDLASLIGRFVGGVPINGEEDFLPKVYESFDRGEKFLIFPEGDKHQGSEAVGKAVNKKICRLPRIYKRYAKNPAANESEVPLLPVGLRCVESPSRRALPIMMPNPWATKLTVIFGEPIYPSENPEMGMDDYMRVSAGLSNLPFGPDQGLV